MKKILMLFAVMAIMMGVTMKVIAQTPTASASAGAYIVVATTVTKTQDLHFGTMSVPTSAATVVLGPNNARSIGTGSIILLPGTPTSTEAIYTTSGPSGGSYQITLPSSVNLTSSEKPTMTATAFTCSESTTAAALTAPGSGNGSGGFHVGATLNLANGQPAGTYSGTFDVTVTTN